MRHAEQTRVEEMGACQVAENPGVGRRIVIESFIRPVVFLRNSTAAPLEQTANMPQGIYPNSPPITYHPHPGY